ncbi:uncharacterized protein [Ptychodera flava]|uniref:uncharacterized protein n=1 Tax=Ptychodera flava TaxID=63121 RepID=UPI003969FDC0
MASSDARPSTSDGRGGVAATGSYGNGGRRGTATTKPKRNMANKALIVCERWRPSICGGLPDALHLAIRLLQDMNISVHCTALQATIEEVEDAEKHGVTLVLPTQSGTLQFRKPHRDWLLHHYEYYPHLEELANVKFVFGFSGFTSEAAFKITSKVFPRVSCYLINLFDKDDLTPLIVGCSKEELEFRKRILSKEFERARCAFSLGESVFARYKRCYQETQQYLLSPMVNEKYVESVTSGELRENELFQIISVLQEYELQDSEKTEVVIEALKEAAETIYTLGENSISWKIVGIPPNKVEAILDNLMRTSKMTITPTWVTTTEELDKELLSSHLVLIPPSSTNYSNLTLAAMCAGIPVVYPKMSHCHATVNKHIDILEATDCAVDMYGGPDDLKKRILSVITENGNALERANRIRKHIREKVIVDQQGINEEFVAALSGDMLASSDDEHRVIGQADLPGEQKTVSLEEGETESVLKMKRIRGAEHEQAPGEMVAEQVELTPTSSDVGGVPDEMVTEQVGSTPTSSDVGGVQIGPGEVKSTSRRKRRHSNEAQTSEVDVQTASTGEREVESGSKSKQARKAEHILVPAGEVRESAQVNPVSSGISEDPSEKKSTKRGKRTSKTKSFVDEGSEEDKPTTSQAAGFAQSDRQINQGVNVYDQTAEEIEIKVKPVGIIPKKGRTVGEVNDAFYSNTQTEINADQFGKDLDNRHKNMQLQKIGKSSISYVMTCRSLDALESLMDSYRNEGLQRTVTTTFVSDQLLGDIGAIYLSLGVSIDYEEYYLCQEELKDTEDADILGVESKEPRISADNTDVTDLQQKKLEEIESMNDKMEREIKTKQMSNSVEQSQKREKVKNRDILRAMENKEKRDCDAKIDELMSEWVHIKSNLTDVSEIQSGLVFTRRQLIQKAGAIIHEVDIPLEIKQELLLVFQKFLPAGPEKTTEPDPKLVIEGSVLMDYVENTVHDADIPTERKQEIIQRFSDFIKDESKKMTVKDRLTAQQVKLQERANAIVDDANIPDQLKETYVNWRRVERGTPLSNTVRVLLSRDGKKSSGEVFDPWGLTINQNGHVLVCDNGHGSVKTVTADTAQILTSVTVHGLPHNFKPTDTKMADNGDYYTADIGNKCIVVSDAKSEVKQIIAMGKLKFPTGVFVDKDRNVFIADYHADCVIKCNGDGDIISSQQLSKP